MYELNTWYLIPFLVMGVLAYWFWFTYPPPISGKEFNRRYPEMRFYKFIGKKTKSGKCDMTNRDYTYKYGRNTVPYFYPYADCSGRGLYFSDQENIKHYSMFGYKLFRVKVPDDAIVAEGTDKWKADSVIISELTKTDILCIPWVGKRQK